MESGREVALEFFVRLCLLGACFLCACPPFPPEGSARFACERSEDCATGLCTNGQCETPCQPKTCSGFPEQCGRQDDGCGGLTDNCTCTAPMTCGAIFEGRCGCAPADCAGQCKETTDGCGKPFPCDCLGEERCVAEQCICEPKSCEGEGLNCGELITCGQTLNCGQCTFPERCSGGGVAGVCGRPAACIQADSECGYVLTEAGQGADCGACPAPQSCGGGGVPGRCGRPAICENLECGAVTSTAGFFDCGGCAPGFVCAQGACAPDRRDRCYGAQTRWTEVDPSLERRASRGRVVSERGELWYYQRTSFWEGMDPGRGCTRFGRLKLSDWTSPMLETRMQLPVSDLDEAPTSLCSDRLNANCQIDGAYVPPDCVGWVGEPIVRSDSLELFFSASFPCADWWDNEIYLAFRADVFSSWSQPILLSGLSGTARDACGQDGVNDPVLLPDGQTLIYRGRDEDHFRIARRRTTLPGDANFFPDNVPAFRDPSSSGDVLGLKPRDISCDGQRLLYVRYLYLGSSMLREELREAELLSLDPLELGPPKPHSADVVFDVGSGGRPRIEAAHESSDCGTIYYSTHEVAYYKRQVSCP